MSRLSARGLWKQYQEAGATTAVLHGASLEIADGEFVAVYGASGTGKSTLLHILGGLDRPEKGDVEFEGEPLYTRSEKALAAYRNRSVGFVFQFYHLMPEFTAEENVMIPCLISGVRRNVAKARATELLDTVGLSDRRTHRPAQLSGGEQQRVAIARALAQSPKLLLADEPTGNLDEAMGQHVMELLRSMGAASGASIVMVTHNPDLIESTDRRLELREGVLHDVV
jgi:lipoprotein-releasing system ATP-binding protein